MDARTFRLNLSFKHALYAYLHFVDVPKTFNVFDRR